MASRCRKFVPNVFNKTKCKSCFGAKESHSAEALESSKAARKISKCSYLFVAPDFDFSNPLQRTKRWQRRFFVLYDDGELTYSVDDNPTTVPQGSVDMNKCTDVFDAEEQTGHDFSIGIEVPGELPLHIKGEGREEIRRWFDVLVMYPRSLTKKSKKGPGGKQMGVSRHHSFYPTPSEKSVSDDEDGESVHSKDSDSYERASRTRGRYKQRDLRRSKSEVRPSDLRQAEDEYIRKSSRESSREASPAYALSLPKSSKSADAGPPLDKVDAPTRKVGEPETFTSVRSMKHKKAKDANRKLTHPVAKSSTAHFDVTTLASAEPISKASRRLSSPNLGKSPNHRPVIRTASNVTDSRHRFSSGTDYNGSPLTGLDANETDEHKIAKSEHARKTLEKAPIVRKGWLVKQDNTTSGWSRHWFVLCGTSLSFYQDAKAEENNQLDGVIDIGSAYQIATVKAERNHGFVVKTHDGDFVLSAMTSGIRRNWIEAIESIMSELRKAEEKSAREDMGFVFEPPLRLSTPSNSEPVPAAASRLSPVVPNSASRINNALREMAEKRKETGDDTPLDELYPSTDVPTDPNAPEHESPLHTPRQTSNIPSPLTLSQSPIPSIHSDPQSPKSPSAFVSPSQRIKEKSRARTPPRRSPPPPTTSTPITQPQAAPEPERNGLLPSSGSSDENDESLNAKLLESQKQVQRLQQQCQDVSSTVKKQCVEIESLQTKLELTTSQLRDMETALTHSAQNLNKERKHVTKLTDAMKNIQDDWKEKYSTLERQHKELSLKLANEEQALSETECDRIRQLEEDLKQAHGKNVTMERLLGNTRKHLQNAVDTNQDQQLQYETRMEEMENEFADDKMELTEKLSELEGRLSEYITHSNNSTNSELTTQTIKEKSQAIQRLEEANKELRGKLEALSEGHILHGTAEKSQAENEELSALLKELDELRKESIDMRHHTQNLQSENLSLRDRMDEIQADNHGKIEQIERLAAVIHELEDRCQGLSSKSAGSEAWQVERAELRDELESVTLELNSALESSQHEISSLRKMNQDLAAELKRHSEMSRDLRSKNDKLEKDLKAFVNNNKTGQVDPTKELSMDQAISMVESIGRTAERMTESAVAMVQGEMIETDIKVSVNFNQQLRNLIDSRSQERMKKSLNGVRQRLNYLVKNGTSQKLFDVMAEEKQQLEQEVMNLQATTPTRKQQSSDQIDGPSIESSALSKVMTHLKAEMANLSSDLNKMDIDFCRTKIVDLHKCLQELDEAHNKGLCFSESEDIKTYAERLGLQAAAMFELARASHTKRPQSEIYSEVESLLKQTSGSIKSINDLALRSYASLVVENLLISHELDNIAHSDKFRGKVNHSSSKKDIVALSLASQALYRFNHSSLDSSVPLTNEASIQSHLSYLFNQNRSPLTPSQRTEQLSQQLTLLTKICQDLDTSLHQILREHMAQYTTDLVNFGVISIAQMDSMLNTLVDVLYSSILDLCRTCNIAKMTSQWIYEKVRLTYKEFEGVGQQDMPIELRESVLTFSLVEVQCSGLASLIESGPSLNQALEAQASNLAGMSAELYKQAHLEGTSTEDRLGLLACKLMENERLLFVHTQHYGDAVQEVMKDVVHSLHQSLLRFALTKGKPEPSTVLHLKATTDKLQLQLTKSVEAQQAMPEVDEHAVGELKEEIDVMKVEHSKELEESKRDMRMVLKSVKAEEFKLATELTEEIGQLRNLLQEERRVHVAQIAELQLKLNEANPEELTQLKQKIRALESCLHDMQGDFEEDIYQERRDHQEEIEHLRSDLLLTLNKIDSKSLSEAELIEKYKAVVEKLESEQASLQQWIDEMRAAHHDEMAALLHEKDMALKDEVTATQAAVEAMEAAHKIRLEEERSRYKEAEERATKLVETERKLILETKDNETKEKRIADLEEKMSAAHRQLAKFELDSRKQTECIGEIQAQNLRLIDSNKSVVEQFSQELGRLQKDKPSNFNEAQHMRLKAQIEGLTESLKLEQLDKRQLSEKIALLESTHQQQLKQQEEQLRAELKPEAGDDVVLRRRLRGRSPSPHARRSSPSMLARSHDSSGLKSETRDIRSPRKLADKGYDLSRSKSATHVITTSKPLPARGTRLSTSDISESPTDGSFRGLSESYHKTGGTSLAERMRKFK